MERLRLLANVIIIGLLAVNLSVIDRLNYRLNKLEDQQKSSYPIITKHLENIDSSINKLNDVHPSLGKGGKWGANICKRGTFLGFLLTEPVDTAVTNALKEALTAYSGPEAKINSLRRHYNKSSEHYHGRAVDLAWDEDVIEYLLSEDGQKWLCAHGLCFYIEGKPGSRKVAKYNKRPEARKFVFHNPEATGDHIHLNLT